MNRVVTAVFDGHALQLDMPLDLEPNARYQITMDLEPVAPPNEEPSEDAWDVLERLAGTIEMPPDWAIEQDHYLYGTPKRGDERSE